MSPYSLVDVSSIRGRAPVRAVSREENAGTRIVRHGGVGLLVGTTFACVVFALVAMTALLVLLD